MDITQAEKELGLSKSIDLPNVLQKHRYLQSRSISRSIDRQSSVKNHLVKNGGRHKNSKSVPSLLVRSYVHLYKREREREREREKERNKKKKERKKE